MQETVSAIPTRNLKDAKANRLTIVDPEGTEHTFPIGPAIHVQTDGQSLTFHFEVGGLHNEDSRAPFIRALSGF